MRWARHVARMVENKNIHAQLRSVNVKGSGHVRDLVVDVGDALAGAFG